VQWLTDIKRNFAGAFKNTSKERREERNAGSLMQTEIGERKKNPIHSEIGGEGEGPTQTPSQLKNQGPRKKPKRKR